MGSFLGIGDEFPINYKILNFGRILCMTHTIYKDTLYANNKLQTCVRPFCAASWSGVNSHLSVALTLLSALMSSCAISAWPKLAAL